VLRRAIETKFQSSTLAREINFPEFWGYSLLEACLFRVSLGILFNVSLSSCGDSRQRRDRERLPIDIQGANEPILLPI
jgi:hypothetical protein